MEGLMGTNAAAAIIYASSGSHPVPNWTAPDAGAMADLRKRAQTVAEES
jgi:hypothetical protein